MKKGEIVSGSLSGLSFLAAFDAYAGTGTSSWLADLCLSGDTPVPMIEGMPMEDHSRHAAYFTAAGLTFLAVGLGWEAADTHIKKFLGSEPQGLARKRLLAVIIFVMASANRGDRQAIEQAFESFTGHPLHPNEADKAFAYLMRENAPALTRILAGAGKTERRRLLRVAVFTWSSHGMDSDRSTQVTERIVDSLGFDQDDICRTLDRIWLKDRARSGFYGSCHAIEQISRAVFRAALRGTRASAIYLAPRAKHIGLRALATLQR